MPRACRPDNSTACATCHKPDLGFTDQLATSKGICDQHGQRNAPTMLNAMFNVTQFWDRRAPTLEEQAVKQLALGLLHQPMRSAFRRSSFAKLD
jgi:cytochrome c peroxidase